MFVSSNQPGQEEVHIIDNKRTSKFTFVIANR